MRLMDALEGGRWDILSQAILDVIGIEVDPDQLKGACLNMAAYYPTDGYDCRDKRADDTVMMWLRNRLDELKAIPHGEQSNREVLTCVFNMGFATVVETEEHIYNLKNFGGTFCSFREYFAARSKITDCMLALRAIDRVAARVGPKER